MYFKRINQIYEDGGTYDGMWVNGLREGEGKLTRNTGELDENGDEIVEVYVGNFKADVPHGVGTFSRSDGTFYKGQWYKGKKQGRG